MVCTLQSFPWNYDFKYGMIETGRKTRLLLIRLPLIRLLLIRFQSVKTYDAGEHKMRYEYTYRNNGPELWRDFPCITRICSMVGYVLYLQWSGSNGVALAYQMERW